MHSDFVDQRPGARFAGIDKRENRVTDAVADTVRLMGSCVCTPIEADWLRTIWSLQAVSLALPFAPALDQQAGAWSARR